MGWVHARAWRATYTGVMSDAFLRSLDQVAMGVRWSADLAAADRSSSDTPSPDAYVALLGGSLVGIAASGPDRDGDDDGVGELWMVNVEPDHQGRGVGRALVDAAVESLRAHGHSSAVLWVTDANSRARGFYEHLGWWADGTTRIEEVGGAAVAQVRYRSTLGHS